MSHSLYTYKITDFAILMEKLIERKLNGSKLWELYKDKHNENVIETLSDILDLNSIK